jgi:glutaredoxin-related protein
VGTVSRSLGTRDIAFRMLRQTPISGCEPCYARRMSRPALTADKLTDSVHALVAGFHRDIVDEVAAAVARDHLVVVGMAQNPFVKKARKLLEARGVKFTYLEYGSYLGKWKERLAIKLWAGFPTFPMVFIDGVLQGGYSELVELDRRGALA